MTDKKGTIEDLKLLIAKKSKIVVTVHQNPDGDALGSASALALYLKSCGHSVNIITPNSVPLYLRSVEAYDMITDYLCYTPYALRKLREAEIIFCLDYNDISSRTGEIGVHITKNTTAVKVMIDHHQQPDLESCDLVFSDSNECSTAHLLLRIFKEMGVESAITKEIASAFYTGIMTDTGNLSFGNLTPELYRNISILIEKGANPPAIINRISNIKSEESMRLKGYAIAEKMVVNYHTCSAYIILTDEELKRFTYTSGDTEGLVNMPLSIKGIYNSALFTEADGFIKISLRSVKDAGVDMNEFARTHFVGGGHKNAAGARHFGTIEEARDIYIKALDAVNSSL